MLQVADRVEAVLERPGDVRLDVRRAGARIGGEHHDGVRFNVRIEVYRQTG